jgi:hypothetical protein
VREQGALTVALLVRLRGAIDYANAGRSTFALFPFCGVGRGACLT